MGYTKLGLQFLEDPPESFLIHCNGMRGVLIVGGTESLKQLKRWTVATRVGRMIELEAQVEEAKARNDLSEIPKLAIKVADQMKAVADAVELDDVWWEIPPIMPPVNAWMVAWTIAMLREMRKRKLRSIAFGFAVGQPQIHPFDSAQSPDEWPQLYSVLKVMDEIGTGWTRIGFEEYIINGNYNPADHSAVGRVKLVYDTHIIPNGWNILSMIIEFNFDVPAMLDIPGMNPDRALGTIDKPGWADADREYQKMPYVDTVFLYAVVDPSKSTEEAFAITPGNKNGPGYLEKLETYFSANPPEGPITEVPPPPPPDPDPDPDPPTPPAGINLLRNASFEGEYAFITDPNSERYDRFGDRKVPEFWGIWWNTAQASPHAELEKDPPHTRLGPTALRLWSDNRFHAWGYQTLDVEIGATYQYDVWAFGRRLGGAGLAHLQIAVDFAAEDDYTVASLKTTSDIQNEWNKLTLTFMATSSRVSVFVAVRTGDNGRGDAWFDAISLTKIVVAPPPPPPPPVEYTTAYVIGDGTRVRKEPNTASAILWQTFATESVLVNPVQTAEGWYRLRPRPAFPDAYIRADLLTFTKPQG